MFWRKKKQQPAVAETVIRHNSVMKPRYINANDIQYYLGMNDSGRTCVYTFFDDIKKIPELKIDENTSDGYHTFKELYHHRAVLFSVICKAFHEKAWKSKLHSDGSMFDGMFIVGINTPEGQATYHYDIDPYWNMFVVRELDRAPEFDGHTPDDAIRRIGGLTPWFPPTDSDTLNTIVTPYTLTCQDFEAPEAYYYESDPE